MNLISILDFMQSQTAGGRAPLLEFGRTNLSANHRAGTSQVSTLRN